MQLDDEDTNSQIVNALRAGGIENLQIVSPEINETFEIGEPDLAILSYDGTEESSRRLRIVIQSLHDRVPAVPIIVYTFRPNGESIRIAVRDEAPLASYQWYVPANFPLQLLAHVNTLLRRPIPNTDA